jgi:hypothetical protein
MALNRRQTTPISDFVHDLQNNVQRTSEREFFAASPAPRRLPERIGIPSGHIRRGENPRGLAETLKWL